MESWLPLTTTGVYLWCFLLSIVSALVPWVNGEAILLSLTALKHSPMDLLALVLLTSAGQMAGKCALYWTSRGAIPIRSGRISHTIASWKERFERSPSRPLALVFISSAVGILTFYVVTILAGAFRVRFGPYFIIGACGRLVRFGALVFIPWVTFRLVG